MIRAAVLAVAAALSATSAQAACGADPQACEIDTGRYHIELPDTAPTAMPAVMFLHGHGGSGAGVMRMRGVIEALTGRGYAVIAPTAEPRGPNGRRSWNFFPGWQGRDEAAFLQDVRADAAQRFGVMPDRVLLAGFSAGGFMVNYLACAAPASFPAYAPVSGGFWRPRPESCAGPVRLFHTHGWRDTVVPIEGRALGGGAFRQDDVFAGLKVWRGANGCAGDNPDSYSETGDFWRRTWNRCATGSALELALFPGGHRVPQGWPDMVLDWFETSGVK